MPVHFRAVVNTIQEKIMMRNETTNFETHELFINCLKKCSLNPCILTIFKIIFNAF